MGGGIFKLAYLQRVMVKYFDSQIGLLQIWYQYKAYTLLSGKNITKSHLGIITCTELHFIPLTVCRTHQWVYRGQRVLKTKKERKKWPLTEKLVDLNSKKVGETKCHSYIVCRKVVFKGVLHP